MQLYSQRDPRWANHALGWGPALGTIGAYGCFDTVLAMIACDSFGDMAYTPATLDDVFTARRIFARDPSGTYDLLPDNALDRSWPMRFSTFAYAGFRADLIKAAVPSKDTYAVLWIATAAVPTHFVLAYNAAGTYIADPWTGRIGTLAGYGGPGAVHRTILIRKLPQVAPVVVKPGAPPPPVVKPPPVIITPPAPDPVPPAPVPVPTMPPPPPGGWAAFLLWLQSYLRQLVSG